MLDSRQRYSRRRSWFQSRGPYPACSASASPSHQSSGSRLCLFVFLVHWFLYSWQGYFFVVHVLAIQRSVISSSFTYVFRQLQGFAEHCVGFSPRGVGKVCFIFHPKRPGERRVPKSKNESQENEHLLINELDKEYSWLTSNLQFASLSRFDCLPWCDSHLIRRIPYGNRFTAGLCFSSAEPFGCVSCTYYRT